MISLRPLSTVACTCKVFAECLQLFQLTLSDQGFKLKDKPCGCMAKLFIGLPMVFAFTSPKFKAFETQRSIVLGDPQSSSVPPHPLGILTVSFIQTACIVDLH